MFNQKELQVLIGGTEEPVDIDDLMQNCAYGGVYDSDHAVVQRFWKVNTSPALLSALRELTSNHWLTQVARSLNQKERQFLLRFVTSCSRPPLL
jgi:ubiquitin-protein ligase E3 C